MKMIATTKLGKAQRAMTDAKAYGAANGIVFTESEAGSESTGASADGKKTLYVVVSSDKGLCGGIHSSVAKRARAELGEGSEAQVSVICLDGIDHLIQS